MLYNILEPKKVVEKGISGSMEMEGLDKDKKIR